MNDIRDDRSVFNYDAHMEIQAKKAANCPIALKPRYKQAQTYGILTEIEENGKYYSVYIPNNGKEKIVFEIKPKDDFDYSFKRTDPNFSVASALKKAIELNNKCKDNLENENFDTDIEELRKKVKQILHYEKKYNSEAVLSELNKDNLIKDYVEFYFDFDKNKDIFIDNLYINEKDYENIKKIFENIIYVKENNDFEIER